MATEVDLSIVVHVGQALHKCVLERQKNLDNYENRGILSLKGEFITDKEYRFSYALRRLTRMVALSRKA